MMTIPQIRARRWRWALGAALGGALWVALAPRVAAAEAAAAAPVKLIDRELLFGNPLRAQARLSPDGRWLSWLAPRDGVLNIWVAPVSDLAAARALTAEKVRPIRQHFWAASSELVLYVNDQGGDENYRLFGVEIGSGASRTYTPFEKTQVQIVAISTQRKNEILISINNRDPQWHDVYHLDLKSGALALVRENNEWTAFDADDALTLRLASKQTDAGGFEVYPIDASGAVRSEPLLRVPPEDSLTTGTVGFSADGKTLYARDSRERDTGALVTLDLATGAPTVLAASAQADVAATLNHPVTRRPQAYLVDYLKPEWTALDPAISGDLEFLRGRLGDVFTVTSRTDDDRLWTVASDPVTGPTAFWLYERAAKQLKKLFVTRPELEGQPLAPMHPLEITARDGLKLTAYLSLPLASDPDRDGRPAHPLPLVLVVHGGPWARDEYGFEPEHQWLANRGYAVLSVNYRGSEGFGKRFLNAANGEFAGRMHDDLIDAVRWATHEKIADPQKIGIYGGSYGGYATLVGLTFTPDVFACGVDLVGPSSLVTLIESFPPYWRPFLEATWYKRVGDPRTPDGREFLLSRSPITRANAVVKPLLIAQGANDPRVTKKESDQLVAALRERDVPVTYLLYPDEGHGFARPENRMSFYATAEAFLAKWLGGRFQEVGDDLGGSSLQVLEGAANVPGLEAAAGAH